MHPHRLAVVLVLTLFALLLVCTSPAHADGIVYVMRNATGANDGSSWADAYTDLSMALSNTISGEVWVAAGVYTPTLRADPADARTATFSLTDSVAVYGGFAGGETVREQRDWIAHETTLSGDLLGNDNANVEIYESTRSDNAYHVVTAWGSRAGTRLDGFAITGGMATRQSGSMDPRGFGGGLLSWGGYPALVHIAFRNNVAYYGGGMGNLYSHAMLTDCVFAGNIAWGGGGLHDRNQGSISLSDCLFNGNSAVEGGSGGGVFIHYSHPSLANVTFRENTAGMGGGMRYSYGDLLLTDATFIGNTASRGGGGLWIDTSAVTVTNGVFAGNTAPRGGGVFGAGRWGDERNVWLVNSTFGENAAGEGSAVYLEFTQATLHNSILWNTVGPEMTLGTRSSAALDYCLVRGGYATGTHILDTDPLFADAANGDLHLRPDSPAIDAGNDAYVLTATDTDGNPRIHGTHVDLGAYERLQFSSFIYLPRLWRR